MATLGWWVLNWSGMLVKAEIRWESEWPKTDFSQASVDLNEIMSGGPPKDGIPAIDNPKFVSSEGADGWLDA
ncbi:MAG: hypothetical protein ACE5HM_04925, partial [Acidiferrobacterales bacterium]